MKGAESKRSKATQLAAGNSTAVTGKQPQNKSYNNTSWVTRQPLAAGACHSVATFVESLNA